MSIGDFGTPVPLSASGVVSARPCLVIGFLPTVSGTITLYDHASSATGTAKLAAYTVTAGQPVPLSFAMSDGCYAALSSAQGTFVMVPLL